MPGRWREVPAQGPAAFPPAGPSLGHPYASPSGQSSCGLACSLGSETEGPREMMAADPASAVPTGAPHCSRARCLGWNRGPAPFYREGSQSLEWIRERASHDPVVGPWGWGQVGRVGGGVCRHSPACTAPRMPADEDGAAPAQHLHHPLPAVDHGDRAHLPRGDTRGAVRGGHAGTGGVPGLSAPWWRAHHPVGSKA